MFRITAYTIGCNPTKLAEAEDFEIAREHAGVFIDWIIERAFGAEDFSEVEDERHKYGELKAEIENFELGGEVEHEFGPLPDGYCIKIATFEPEPESD